MARAARRPHAALIGLLAVTLGISAGATAWAATGSPGVAVSVNGVAIQGQSPRVPGCAVEIAVSGIGTGDHAVGIAVVATTEATEAKTTTVVDVPPATVSTGSLTVGPFDLTTLVKTLGLIPMDNGYHLRVNVAVDGAQVFSKPFWLACGRAQHAGHSVRVTFAVLWVDAAGRTGTAPPRGLASGYVLTATSTHGTATCRYTGAQLVCDYPPGEPGESAPPSLQVAGLGSYTVSEQGLPPGWLPDPATVGEFAATPTLPGAGSEHQEEDAATLLAATAEVHTVVNVQRANLPGYLLVGANGDVHPLGDARYYGSMGTKPPYPPEVGMASTPDGRGY